MKNRHSGIFQHGFAATCVLEQRQAEGGTGRFVQKPRTKKKALNFSLNTWRPIASESRPWNGSFACQQSNGGIMRKHRIQRAPLGCACVDEVTLAYFYTRKNLQEDGTLLGA